MTSIAVPILVLLTLPAWGQEADTRAAIAVFERELAEAEKLRDDGAPFNTNYPLARLALKKARLLANRGPFFGTRLTPNDVLETGREALQRLRAGIPYRAEPGRLTELAYEADNDGSVQPYYLYLPSNFDPGKRWPLIVFLHGYVPSITVLDPWLLPAEVCEIAGENGCMLLIPYGRRNTDFQGVGEVDVLETIALVRNYYPLDERRVYMSGVSMGGMGAWNMALRHPGMFAAVTPIAGHSDMLTWWGWPKDQVPPFKKWLIEWDNPIDLVMNARGQKVFVQHGEKDQLIPVDQSRRIVAAGQQLGLPLLYHEFKGEGHYIYWGTECFEKAWGWQKQFSLEQPLREIDFKTYSLEYDTAHWLRIDRIQKWGQPATISIRVADDGKTVNIQTDNVAAFALQLDQGGLRNGPTFTVNGKAWMAHAQDGPWAIFELAGQQPPLGFPPPKRKGLCGPVEEVFDTPFLVVQGTAGDNADDADLAAKVGTWANEWDAFADGYPRVATDAEVTDKDLNRYNLVLFGTPHTNSLLARIADKLPINIGDHEYKVGDRGFRGKQLGLVMCYPNPLAPHKYVLVYSGEYYGTKLPVNHKHDLLPDFLIFRADRFLYDDTNEWVCGGFFDSTWHLSPDTTWVNERALP